MSLREELEALYARNSRLTPADVVEAARPEGAPRHDRVEWDDEIAGEQYRISQARDLIRRVRIRIEDENDEPISIPRFVSIPRPDATRSYMPVEEVRENVFATKLLMLQAERDWKALKRRYAHLATFMAQVADEAAQIAATGE
jgi:hypothetical protein